MDLAIYVLSEAELMCNMLVGNRFAEKANLHLSFVRVLMKGR